MKLRVGRFKDKPDADFSLSDQGWSTGGKWCYVVWAEDTEIEAYNHTLDPDAGYDPDIEYDPEIHLAEISPYAVDVPEAIAKMVGALNSIDEREGMQGVSYAGYALLDDLKRMVAKAFAMGSGDDDPQYVAKGSYGYHLIPLL